MLFRRFKLLSFVLCVLCHIVWLIDGAMKTKLHEFCRVNPHLPFDNIFLFFSDIPTAIQYACHCV